MASNKFWKLLVLLVISLILDEVCSQKQNGPKNLRLVWSNCGTSSDPMKINDLNITPQPLVIPGDLTLTADVDITSNISSPIKASVLIKKKSILGWIDLPCLNNMGSCTYKDVCAMLPFKGKCPEIFSQNNIPCTCPLPQGHYAVTNYSFPVKDVGPHWLEHGTYKAKVTLSKDDHLLGCYEFSIQLK